MNWHKYLALINWQGQKISFDDFNKLDSLYNKIQSLDDFHSIVQNPPTQKFLIENPTWWKQAKIHEEICHNQNIQLTWPGDIHFPKLLRYYSNAPTLLSYRGTPCWNNQFQLCLVGSRKISPITQSWMDHHLSSFLMNNNVCLLSGGARGVDQKGHSLAIQSQTPTLCFLPCGLSHFYPPELMKWEKAILNTKGAFISLFPPSAEIQKSFFHVRNSLMVYMSQIVFILQAEERSGSMLTARFSINSGVTLCTLPGPVMNPLFKGNLKLINDGILMIRDEKDLSALYQVQRIYLDSIQN